MIDDDGRRLVCLFVPFAAGESYCLPHRQRQTRLQPMQKHDGRHPHDLPSAAAAAPPPSQQTLPPLLSRCSSTLRRHPPPPASSSPAPAASSGGSIPLPPNIAASPVALSRSRRLRQQHTPAAGDAFDEPARRLPRPRQHRPLQPPAADGAPPPPRPRLRPTAQPTALRRGSRCPSVRDRREQATRPASRPAQACRQQARPRSELHGHGHGADGRTHTDGRTDSSRLHASHSRRADRSPSLQPPTAQGSQQPATSCAGEGPPSSPPPPRTGAGSLHLHHRDRPPADHRPVQCPARPATTHTNTRAHARLSAHSRATSRATGAGGATPCLSDSRKQKPRRRNSREKGGPGGIARLAASSGFRNRTVPRPLGRPSGPLWISAKATLPYCLKMSFSSCHFRGLFGVKGREPSVGRRRERGSGPGAKRG